MSTLRPVSTLCAALVCAASLAAVASACPGDVPPIAWEDFTGTTADGSPLPGRLGRLRVPEDRARPDGRTIELAFVRFESSAPDKGPPIVYLEGGPGGSGVDGCQWPATVPLVDLLAYGDVIGLDQRGTGLSRPALDDAPAFTYELPLDAPLTRDALETAWSDALARGVAWWSARDVDLDAYTTAASADDVDDLRRALGEERVVLYGSSYGTHLALACLRRHGEHVARALLAKVEGPDQTFKLPSTVQRFLEQIDGFARADADISAEMPDMLGALREVLGRLADEPVTASAADEEGRQVEIVLGPFDVQWALTQMLGRTRELVQIPDVVHRMAGGDFSRVAGLALALRRSDVGSAMAFMTDCASGATPARLARIAREASDPANLLGDAIDAPYPQACAGCGGPDLGDAFRAPIVSDVPVLFVSGDLDARTPPSNVEELLPGFRNGVHVLVEGTGHDGREVLSPEYRALVSAFLRGGQVEPCTIVLPGFRLMPLGFELPAGR